VDNRYSKAAFLKSAAHVKQLPEDLGFEVAFAGRSNAGKSSALNCLIGRQLARTSKTPGRTQLLNVFIINEDISCRLVDLPGYGFAKVPMSTKQHWQTMLAHYLETRQSLRGLILLMDIRHPLKDLDQKMMQWARNRSLPMHVLLTKADKLSRSAAKNTLSQVQQQCDKTGDHLTVQLFSALKKQGIEELIACLDNWLIQTPAA